MTIRGGYGTGKPWFCAQLKCRSALLDAQRLHLEANKAEMAGRHDAAKALHAEARTLEALARLEGDGLPLADAAQIGGRFDDQARGALVDVWASVQSAMKALSEAQNALWDALNTEDSEAALRALGGQLRAARDHLADAAYFIRADGGPTDEP